MEGTFLWSLVATADEISGLIDQKEGEANPLGGLLRFHPLAFRESFPVGRRILAMDEI